MPDNPDISIKNVMSILRILKHEYIRGKISKDQYDILKENIADVIKDLIRIIQSHFTTFFKIIGNIRI